jgi:hypothetical protein
MIAILQMDSIVHQSLYSYGLQFSYDWATPYWTAMRAAFAMAGVAAAVGISSLAYLPTRKPEPESKQEKQWNTYKLRDGSTIKVKHVLRAVRQLPAYGPDGAPIYSAVSDSIVQLVDFPEELRKKPEEKQLSLV